MGVLLVWESQNDGIRMHWGMGDIILQAFSDHIPTNQDRGHSVHIDGVIAKLNQEENTATISYFCRTVNVADQDNV